MVVEQASLSELERPMTHPYRCPDPQNRVARLEDLLSLAVALLADERGISIEQVRDQWAAVRTPAVSTPPAPPPVTPTDPEPSVAVMAREGEWLCADACAFLLGMLTPKGKVNRRGFLERVAVRTSFPKPLQLGGEKKWNRLEVLTWADSERKISRR